MPQSLAQLYVHLVFSTKERQPFIKPDDSTHLHAYLAGTCNAIDCPAIIVGGVADHVHILLRLSINISLADAVYSSVSTVTGSAGNAGAPRVP